MKKGIKIISTVFSLAILSACGGGDTAADNADGCVVGVRVDGGAEYTNSCDITINMAVFNPIYRFVLEPGETEFLARTENLTFAACEAPSRPKEFDDGFICD